MPIRHVRAKSGRTRESISRGNQPIQPSQHKALDRAFSGPTCQNGLFDAVMRSDGLALAQDAGEQPRQFRQFFLPPGQNMKMLPLTEAEIEPFALFVLQTGEFGQVARQTPAMVINHRAKLSMMYAKRERGRCIRQLPAFAASARAPSSSRALRTGPRTRNG